MRLVVSFVSALIAVSTAQAPQPDACTPPDRPGRSINVRSVDELERATSTARTGDTILINDGRYRLRHSLDIAVPGVSIRGKSNDRSKVVLHGGGMVGDDIGVALSISAPDITIADVTIRDVGFHAIQVRGEKGASRFALYRSALLDAGQQLLKGSVSQARIYADNGLVACSDFSYTTTAPSNYTNGVDLLATRGWTIRDNRFQRIRGPEADRFAAGPAILVWMASEDTVVERNLIIDSFRGIALGLQQELTELARNGERTLDHKGGLIRQNVIVNLNSWADEAIEANVARDVRIEHNTVLVEGSVPFSIAARFPVASATVRNNLTNRQILRRDGGQIQASNNVTNATRAFFVDPLTGNLRLTGGSPAIDAGVVIEGVSTDFDGRPRITGRAPDAGAFEFRPGGRFD